MVSTATATISANFFHWPGIKYSSSYMEEVKSAKWNYSFIVLSAQTPEETTAGRTAFFGQQGPTPGMLELEDLLMSPTESMCFCEYPYLIFVAWD